MSADHPFLSALEGKVPSRVPVWLMRQAGRYLPQYREVRARFPRFTDFLAHPEAAAEVTVQPVDLLDVDAAILFSDILVVLPPLGLELSYAEGEGPRIANPLDSAQRIARLPRFDPQAELGFVTETIRQVRRSLNGRVPLIGFAGAPWTVSCYAVDGGGSKDFARTRSLLYRDPAAAHALFDHLALVTADYLVAQAQAGAQALQLFESWGHLLAPSTYRQSVLPSVQRLVRSVKERTSVPFILYCNGSGTLLEVLREAGADALGLDWRLPLSEARARCGNIPLQGNLDPCALQAPPESIPSLVQELATGAAGGPWIANLGHGLQPGSPLAGVRAFIKAVHELPTGDFHA